jgi:tetratricopeptide (TPR) repeat protein
MNLQDCSGMRLQDDIKKISVPAGLIAAVCVVVVITHWPALSSKALSFDDQQYVTENILVRNPGWWSAQKFLTEVFEPSTVEGYYQPLAMISLMADYAMGGRPENPMVFHRTSLILHTVNTALIIILLYLLFGNMWAAAGMGLLFGVHPLTVEPIPWVGERKTLLAAFFSFLSLILYIHYSRKGDRKLYAGCLAAYFLALMSKPTSVPLPAVMLLMDYWPLRRLSVKTVLEKIPLFVLAGMFAVITYISQSRTAGADIPGQSGHKIADVPMIICHNTIFYLEKIVWPANLSSHYSYPKPLILSNPAILSGVIGTAILIPLLVISLRWTRAAATGWLIFFAAMLPTMQILKFSDVIAADKFVYLPATGLLMMGTSFLIWLGNKFNARVIGAVVLVLASAEIGATRQYLSHWKDTVPLYENMLSFASDSAPVNNSLGVGYGREGRWAEAIGAFKKAIEIDPVHYSAYYNLGWAYGELGRWEEAIEPYKAAIKLRPRYAKAYCNLGVAYGKLGRQAEEEEAYKKAIEITPYLPEAHFNLSAIYGSQGKYEQAAEELEKVVVAQSEDADAFYTLGYAYSMAGRLVKATDAYKRAVKLKPDYVDAHFSLGAAYALTGQKDLATEQYKILQRLDGVQAEKLFSLIGELGRRKSDTPTKQDLPK